MTTIETDEKGLSGSTARRLWGRVKRFINHLLSGFASRT